MRCQQIEALLAAAKYKEVIIEVGHLRWLLDELKRTQEQERNDALGSLEEDETKDGERRNLAASPQHSVASEPSLAELARQPEQAVLDRYPVFAMVVAERDRLLDELRRTQEALDMTVAALEQAALTLPDSSHALRLVVQARRVLEGEP